MTKEQFFTIPEGQFKIEVNFCYNGERFSFYEIISEHEMRKRCPDHPELRENIIKRLEQNDEIN